MQPQRVVPFLPIVFALVPPVLSTFLAYLLTPSWFLTNDPLSIIPAGEFLFSLGAFWLLMPWAYKGNPGVDARTPFIYVMVIATLCLWTAVTLFTIQDRVHLREFKLGMWDRVLNNKELSQPELLQLLNSPVPEEGILRTLRYASTTVLILSIGLAFWINSYTPPPQARGAGPGLGPGLGPGPAP